MKVSILCMDSSVGQDWDWLMKWASSAGVSLLPSVFLSKLMIQLRPWFSFLRQTARATEESSRSFPPSRRTRRDPGPRGNAPLSRRCPPSEGWAEACAPPCAPLCAPHCCRRDPSGRPAVTLGPPACRSLWWASAACSRTSALGREPFVDLMTGYLALASSSFSGRK